MDTDDSIWIIFIFIIVPFLYHFVNIENYISCVIIVCNHSIQYSIITWTLDLDLTTFWLLHLITFIKDYYIYTRLGPYVILNEAYDKISEKPISSQTQTP